ncbi:MAG: thrombospondin type 3 repeat-containing protein, partial [Candidatus Paceibacteria bacterium]
NKGLSCASLPSAKQTPIRPRLGTGDFSMQAPLTGLKDGTTYYYCAMGANNSSMFDALYGEVKEFTTPLSPGSSNKIGPVKTLNATQLDDTEATLWGNYTAGMDGFAYFRVSTAEIPPIFCNDIYGSDMIGVTANDPDPIGYTTGGNFSAHINGLEPETDYYYCAIVSNRAYDPSSARSTSSTQIKYGEVKKFRTLPCDTCDDTIITTKQADVLDSKSATLKGSFKSSRAVKVYFEYTKTTPNPQDLQSNTTIWKSTTPKSHGANSNGNYIFLLKGLEKNTTYSYRAVGSVTNPDEVFYGQTLQFTTNKFDGIDTGDIGGNSGTGTGVITDDGDSSGGGVIVTTGDDNCPAGTLGVFPECVPIVTIGENPECPPGWKGTPPNCFNPGSNGGNDPLVKTPVVSVMANPVTIDAGESSTISWTSAATTSCTLNGYDVPLSGAADTGQLQNSASYTVSCVGPGGSATDTASVFVNIDGDGNGGGDLVSVSVTASPVFVTVGGSATISWSSSGAQFCETGGNGTGTSGSFSTGPLTGSTSYGVTCSGLSGSAGDTAYVEVYTDNGTGGNGTNGNNNNGNNGNGNGNNGNGTNGTFPPGSGNPWTPGGPGGPGDGTNPPLPQDNDNDDDGVGNPHDDDTDGDWDPNNTDTDDDGDGIPDFVDATPNGPGNANDFDGSGLSNDLDTDMDGDGVPNYLDNDTDEDGAPNSLDLDDDSDGIPDLLDPTPKGPHGDRASDLLVLGATATPPVDAIVRYHEGIETVFARQIRKNISFAERYGYEGGDITTFAWNLAHTFAKNYFGYINEENLEVRVAAPDVSAYELRQVSNTLVVYEYYRNKIIDIRSRTTNFKQKNPYEYYFRKIFR